MLRLLSEIILNQGCRTKAVLNEFKDNWINVAALLSVDLFDGRGWVGYDRGEKIAPRPDMGG